MNFIEPKLQQYCEEHTHAEPPLLQALIVETHERTRAPQMLTGRLEGRFLKLLVMLVGAKRVLEIGTFTGYSALSMAEGLPVDGQLITCDIDPLATSIAKKYFELSPFGHQIQCKLGPALATLETLESPFDLVFIDADKRNYPNYYQRAIPLLRSGGLLVVDNALWSGEVLSPTSEDALAIHNLNQLIQSDERVENVLLTVRDGLNLVRKR